MSRTEECRPKCFVLAYAFIEGDSQEKSVDTTSMCGVTGNIGHTLQHTIYYFAVASDEVEDIPSIHTNMFIKDIRSEAIFKPIFIASSCIKQICILNQLSFVCAGSTQWYL